MLEGFQNAESSVHEVFRKLAHVPLEDSTKNALEHLLFQPGTTIDNLTELRLRMVRRKQAVANLQLKRLFFIVSKEISIREHRF